MMPDHRITAAGRMRHSGLALIILLLVIAAMFPGCGSGDGSSGKDKGRSQGSNSRAQERFRFIVCGDPQNNYERFNLVIDAARSVDFMIVAGDLTGSGTAPEFERFVNTMNESGVKWYAVPGNHDVATSPVGENYERYIGPPNHSFNHKGSHFVMIDNSTESIGFSDETRRWVVSDLESAKSGGYSHVFAVAHVPPGYPYSTSRPLTGVTQNTRLAPTLVSGGVEILFCGHLHTYRETSSYGLQILITGGAGAPLHTMVDPDAFHNYILVEVNGDEVTTTVVRI